MGATLGDLLVSNDVALSDQAGVGAVTVSAFHPTDLAKGRAVVAVRAGCTIWARWGSAFPS